MVDLLGMAVTVVKTLRKSTPEWAVRLQQSVDNLTRKVNLLMALDLDVINRILVGAQFLADRDKANQAKIADLTQKLADAGAAEAAEDAADAKANEDAAKVADAVDALVKGNQTPTVEVPAAPADVVDVVNGDAPVVVTDPGPASDGTLTDSSGGSAVSTDTES